MNNLNESRVAWLLPNMGTGGISFQHILGEFSKLFPNTVTFTGQWPGYVSGYENAFNIQKVGATKYIEFWRTAKGYTLGFSYVSPQIITQLLRFKPDVIFANAFTAWTALALLLKPIGGWKVIITYEGGAAIYETASSVIRYRARQLMARFADGFVVNSQAGMSYLLNTLDVDSQQIVAKPFLVPCIKALSHSLKLANLPEDNSVQRPIFLFVGQIVPRKGLKTLLEACSQLQQMGYDNYTLMIVGEGKQRPELEKYVLQTGLEQQIAWTGKVPYAQLGAYFKFADVFVFPTHDDIWGMVIPEAMAFGKPVICSTGAGAAEMVKEKHNGFLFEPEQAEYLAKLMGLFIEDLSLAKKMGHNSLSSMTDHTPEHAASYFAKALEAA